MEDFGFSKEKIASIIGQLASGKDADELCREYDISSSTLFGWKVRYGGTENLLQRLSELEEENYRLKGRLADQEIQHAAKSTGEMDRVYRILAASIPGTAITILDRDERYLLAEGDFLLKMGYTKETMPGKKISEVITPENYKYYEGVIRRAFAGETILVERQTLSGYYSLMNVVPLRDGNNEVFAIMFVLIDVTPLKEAQFALAKSNDELELKVEERTQQLKEVNQQLETFSYSVSHDLRSPLRLILGFTSILKEDYSAKLNDSEFNRMTDVLIRNATKMERLINDLLDFSKLERKEINSSLIDMDKVVNDLVDELKPSVPSEKVSITAQPLQSAWGDLSLIQQVWINLLSNALKYSARNEFVKIEIGCTVKDGFITYSLSDNGVGFDMIYADKLFSVFQRLHNQKDFEGSGIGLALVKNIVQRHGGKVWAEAEKGKGATFYFTLPLIEN